MTNRNRLIHFILRSPERDVVTSTRRQSAATFRLGSKLLQKRSVLLARHQRH
jgi:hypothetical protein